MKKILPFILFAAGIAAFIAFVIWVESGAGQASAENDPTTETVMEDPASIPEE